MHIPVDAPNAELLTIAARRGLAQPRVLNVCVKQGPVIVQQRMGSTFGTRVGDCGGSRAPTFIDDVTISTERGAEHGVEADTFERHLRHVELSLPPCTDPQHPIQTE